MPMMMTPYGPMPMNDQGASKDVKSLMMPFENFNSMFGGEFRPSLTNKKIQ